MKKITPEIKSEQIWIEQLGDGDLNWNKKKSIACRQPRTLDSRIFNINA